MSLQASKPSSICNVWVVLVTILRLSIDGPVQSNVFWWHANKSITLWRYTLIGFSQPFLSALHDARLLYSVFFLSFFFLTVLASTVLPKMKKLKMNFPHSSFRILSLWHSTEFPKGKKIIGLRARLRDFLWFSKWPCSKCVGSKIGQPFWGPTFHI